MINEPQRSKIDAINIIEINNGLFSYDKNSEWSLKIPFLKIRKKQVTAFVGISGSGKSTLLKIFLGQLHLQQGNMSSCEIQLSSKELAYVSQENSLLPWLTVQENIKWFLSKNNHSNPNELSSILKDIDLETHEKKFPNQLSGGQKRRAMLARALATKPKLLILDEPFAGLDIPSRNKLIDVLLNTISTQDLSIILVTHAVEDLALLCNTVHIVLADGEVSSEPMVNNNNHGSRHRSSSASANFSLQIINKMLI